MFGISFKRTFPFVSFGHSVDSVVASFQAQADRLRAIAAHHNAKASEKEDKAAALCEEAEAHDAESNRAAGIANKIGALIA